jgi:HKD family nuclease
MRTIRKLTLAFTLCLILALPLHADEPSPATVIDISDRAYEPAVKNLLREAKSSITISMFAVTLGGEGNNPMKILLEDLLDAAERGVKVTIYLNTYFRNSEKVRSNLIANTFLKKMEDAGAVINLVPSGRKLHDKLIIVDSRYIIEGSANWSVAALRDNFESNTLIDSPGLAEAKLNRLQEIPLTFPEKPGTKTEPLYARNLPATIMLPAALMEDRRYFTDMLTRANERSLDLYLMLVAQAQATGQKEFFVDLETMALSLGLPRSLSDSRLRQEVIKCLKKLERRYCLIKVKYFHGRDAKVNIIDLPGAVFTISSDLIKPDKDPNNLVRRKFYMITKAYLESKGEDISTMSSEELGKRFGVGRTLFYNARLDLEKTK